MTLVYYLSRPFAWILSIFQIQDTLFDTVNALEVSFPLIIMGFACLISCILYILDNLFYLRLYLFKKPYKTKTISSGKIFKSKAMKKTLLNLLLAFLILSALMWIVVAVKGVKPFIPY